MNFEDNTAVSPGGARIEQKSAVHHHGVSVWSFKECELNIITCMNLRHEASSVPQITVIMLQSSDPYVKLLQTQALYN